MKHQLTRFFKITAFCSLAAGCASQRYLGSRGHSYYRDGEYAKAETEFQAQAKKPGTNQLLFLLDYATTLFSEGKYDEAAKIFLRAEDIAAIKDYTSISEEVGTLATSGNVRGYKGEDFEKVLINVYLAMCYAAMGKTEDAQVEARKINLLLYKMITEGKRNYEESPFARYLSALMWEATGETNDAYIDYKKTYELDKSFPGIGQELLGASQRLHFMEDIRQWSEKFPGVSPRILSKDEGEVIIIFQKGLSPRKIPRDGENSSLPRFVPRYSGVSGAKALVDGQVYGELQTVLDIESLSIRYLEDRIGRMFAAKLAGIAVKGAIAAGVRKMSKNDDLGWLTFYALMATDQADLRSWLSLPQSLQMIRIPLKAGEHEISLEIIGTIDNIRKTKDFGKILVEPRKKKFLIGR